MESDSKEKLEKIYADLFKKLENLEEIVIAKIEQNSTASEILNLENADKSELQAKIIEQKAIIENLSDELNKAQKTIKEIGKENDFLKDKNRLFADKIFKFKSQGSKLIQAVEDEVEQVKEIIKAKLK